MAPRSERNVEFTRHVRRMQRQEMLRSARPFAMAGVVVAALLVFMGWNAFSTVPCGTVAGVVQAARAEMGGHTILTVKGEDDRNYYTDDPGDRASPEGARLQLAKSCTHTGQARPRAQFERWLPDGAPRTTNQRVEGGV